MEIQRKLRGALRPNVLRGEARAILREYAIAWDALDKLRAIHPHPRKQFHLLFERCYDAGQRLRQLREQLSQLGERKVVDLIDRFLGRSHVPRLWPKSPTERWLAMMESAGGRAAYAAEERRELRRWERLYQWERQSQ